VDDLVEAQALCDRLGETYQLLFVKGPEGWSVFRPGPGTAADAAAASAPAGVAVAVSRGDGSAHFGYAEDGEMICAFDPAYPGEETMWGADPGRLGHLMTALGLRAPMFEYEDLTDADARAIVLAQRITGIKPATIQP
jgi:hypothetical protein